MVAAEQDRVVTGPAAFSRFYEAAYPDVHRALLLTLRDEELTADAVHEAFARAFARWDEVATYDNPAGWVYRVGLNWARSRLRRWTREVLSGRPRGEASAVMPEPADPSVTIALRGLPVGQRAVVVLRLYLDWSVEDVAAALDVSPGTVKSRLSRALDRLRERLEVSP